MHILTPVSGSGLASASKDVVVVPTYDEREVIPALLSALAAAVPEVDVLVVDDSSPDGTADLVRADARFGTRVFLLERPAKDGLGAAYRAGFAWALHAGYDGIAQMDADLSHPPGRLPSLLAALQRADVVIGSRYTIGGKVSGWTLRRRLLSWGGNAYVRAVLGLATHDCTAGFKAFRASALRRIDVTASTSNGYCFQVENTWHAERAGLRVIEVPITFTDRTAGTSKMTGAIVREALARVLTWRLHELGAHLMHPFRSRVHTA
jgi:dolichol-phosphate mannosyltransferase